MPPVRRDEVLDYVTYAQQRDVFRPKALEAKERRRVRIGEYLTFLFETHLTVLYQVQEMMRVENIVREADIRHELDTYNELLGGPGELGCTLFIGIDDPAARDARLRRWLDLPEKLALRLEDGSLARATWDPRQVGDDRLSSVQYMKFKTGGKVPVSVLSEHPDPEISGETALSGEQRAALAEDLEG